MISISMRTVSALPARDRPCHKGQSGQRMLRKCGNTAAFTHKLQSSIRCLHSLDLEVSVEEIMMFLAVVEMMGCQDDTKHRNIGLQTNLHHAVNDGGCHEIMTIDAAIHHQSCADDSSIFSGF